MILDAVAGLGPWSWMILGLALLAIEVVAPGVFMLWIGIAALLTGTLSLQLAEVGFWTWHVQVLTFLVLSLVSAYVGSRIMRARQPDSDEPLLNRPAERLVGRTSLLEEPIADGRGRIRLGDTLWRVRGPDLPAGTRVRVVSATDGELHVEAHSGPA